jgi:outer membrane biosynthesis protein TonB
MTGPGTRGEQALRHALRAAAGRIEPGADGLERIRARLTTPKPLPVAWLAAVWFRARSLALSWLDLCLDWLRGTAARRRAAGRPGARSKRLESPRGVQAVARQATTPRGAHAQQGLGSLRLVAAVAAAVLVVVAGTLSLTSLPRGIDPMGFPLPFVGQSRQSGQPTAGGGPGKASATGSATPVSGSTRHSSQPATGSTDCPPAKPSSTPSATPAPAPSSSPTSSPPPSPSPTASPSPSATPSPTASPSPSATPSPTASPSPSATPSPTTSPSDNTTPGTSPAATARAARLLAADTAGTLAKGLAGRSVALPCSNVPQIFEQSDVRWPSRPPGGLGVRLVADWRDRSAPGGRGR